MRTTEELIAENLKLNNEIIAKILKLQTLVNEVDDLKKENIGLMLKIEKLLNEKGI